MRTTKLRKTVILSTAACAVSGLALVGTAMPASASSNSASCSVTVSGVTYTGGNIVDYHSYSTTLWELDDTQYKFGPTDLSRNSNNQNVDFFGGSNHYTENSPDNLKRDSNWDPGLKFIYPSVFGQKGKSYMTFTDIFDKSGDDPSCSTRTATF